MLPYIQILGRSIPMYSIMAFAGIISAYIYLLLTYKKLGIEKDDCDFSFIYGLIGVFIGAKLLSLLLSLPNIINDFHMLFDDTEKFLQLYIFSGFIFYGGLIGAFVGALIYIKKYKLNPDLFFKLLVPTIPLVHSIGRIGCFFAGCCYGIPVSNSLGICFTKSFIAPNNVPLLPVQLIESFCNLILFLVLAHLARRGRKGMTILSVYLISYSIIRFILEYFRYDYYRGFIGCFSTSQLISIAVFGVGLYIVLKNKKITE